MEACRARLRGATLVYRPTASRCCASMRGTRSGQETVDRHRAMSRSAAVARSAPEVGSLIELPSREQVFALFDGRGRQGRRAALRRLEPQRCGYFFEPTVLAGVRSEARLLEEEVLGPAAPITTFASEKWAIAEANETEYGLPAYLYTNLRWSSGLRGVGGRDGGDRNDGSQPRPGLRCRRSVRWRQGVVNRPRGRQRGHLGAPGEVRHGESLTFPEKKVGQIQ